MASSTPDHEQQGGQAPYGNRGTPGTRWQAIRAWLGALRKLALLTESTDTRGLEIEAPGLHFGLRRAPGRRVGRTRPAEPGALPRPAQSHAVRAPLTGIWYDGPTPGAPPYVHVGSLVEVGTLIGLIETMKIFNEITCDAAGRIAQIHVRRGDLISAHSSLMTIDTTEAPGAWLRPA